jgi:hypothetical protein
MGALVKIACALGVNLFFLMGEEKPVEEEPLVVVKHQDRQTITSPFRLTNTIYESINYKRRID